MKESITRKITAAVMALAMIVLLVPAIPAAAQSQSTRVAGAFYAPNYGKWTATVDTGNASSGAASIVIRKADVAAPDGTIFVPFGVTQRITINDGTLTETVTPTAVSGCGFGGLLDSCTVTATFTNAHGAGVTVSSGSFGLDEAIQAAFQVGGGAVVIDNAFGGTDSTIAAAVPYQTVAVHDLRTGSTQYWTPTQQLSTILAAPTTLIATTAGFGVANANFTGGAYTGSSTYIACIAYVDIMGNEGPCSATFTIATSGALTTDQIGFTAPAASPGAVGYTIYISLAGGTYNLTYQVPITSAVCVNGLTKLENTTPACPVANATYGQSGSAAIVSALTVNTAPLHLLATTASTTAAYIGQPSGRTSYAYVPHQNSGAPGLTPAQLIYPISTAPATTVPTVLATIPILPGFMNKVGRQLRVCGQATNASGGTATVQNIELLWDAAGSNTAGAPVIVSQMQITATQASSPENYQFCATLQTTVAGAGVTAGSLMPSGVFNTSEAAGTLHSSGPDIKAAAVASLNLAGTGGNTQRLHVVWLHTTGTDATGTTVQLLTVEAI